MPDVDALVRSVTNCWCGQPASYLYYPEWHLAPAKGLCDDHRPLYEQVLVRAANYGPLPKQTELNEV